ELARRRERGVGGALEPRVAGLLGALAELVERHHQALELRRDVVVKAARARTDQRERAQVHVGSRPRVSVTSPSCAASSHGSAGTTYGEPAARSTREMPGYSDSTARRSASRRSRRWRSPDSATSSSWRATAACTAARSCSLSNGLLRKRKISPWLMP